MTHKSTAPRATIINATGAAMRRFRSICLALAVCLAGAVHAQTPAANDLGCPDAGLFGSTLIDGICWSCMFPIKLMGANMGSGDTGVPSGASSKMGCMCSDNLGVPEFGFAAGFWNPSRVLEVTRNPFCSPTLGGKKISDSYRLWGGDQATTNEGHDEGTMKNFHMIAFPMLQMLELMMGSKCNSDGYTDLDIVNMSEFNVMWNDNELDFFANPFGALFAELQNFAAGAASCAMTVAGVDDDWNFWSAGCLGGIYPMNGTVLNARSQGRDTSLVAVRGLAQSHMIGLSKRTWGDDALCTGQISPLLPKSGYRIQRVFPVAESSKPCCHRLGASPFQWGGEWRNIPGVSDYVYMLWKYNDCCMH